MSVGTSLITNPPDHGSYFEGGISSVYLWDMDDGFAGCVLLKKCAFGTNPWLWLVY